MIETQDQVPPEATSSSPCRFNMPNPVFGESDRFPIKWSIDNGVAAAYVEKYNCKNGNEPASEPDPYDFPAFLEYAEAESNICDAEDMASQDAMSSAHITTDMGLRRCMLSRSCKSC